VKDAFDIVRGTTCATLEGNTDGQGHRNLQQAQERAADIRPKADGFPYLATGCGHLRFPIYRPDEKTVFAKPITLLSESRSPDLLEGFLAVRNAGSGGSRSARLRQSNFPRAQFGCQPGSPLKTLAGSPHLRNIRVISQFFPPVQNRQFALLRGVLESLVT
jgi:hypothetical protein